MPTHLYCLLPRGSSAAPAPPARAIDAGPAVAWVGDTADPRVSRDARIAARATLDHDRVVSSSLAQGVTPIPASLADPYPDDPAAVADIAAHAEQIGLAFPAIAGMVEMTMIIALQDSMPPDDAPGRGRAYIEQLRSAPVRAAVIGDRIEREMSVRFPDAARRADGARVAISHLIPTTAVGYYREMARASDRDGYRIVVDGPRAPYSFALFAPRRGLVSPMWLGTTKLTVERHDSSEPGHAEPA